MNTIRSNLENFNNTSVSVIGLENDFGKFNNTSVSVIGLENDLGKINNTSVSVIGLGNYFGLDLLNNFNLIVGLVMKDEWDSRVPNLLELHILETLLTAGVEPLRHVGVAVGTLWWRPNLNIGNTTSTLQLVVGITAI